MANMILPGLRRLARTIVREDRGAGRPLLYKRAFLREIEIFRDLTTDDLALLDETTHMVTIPRRQMIYHQEDAGGEFYLLKEGRVRLSRISLSGKKLELAILEPGTFFGEMPLLGEQMRNASAETLDQCLVCIMSQADVEGLLLRKPQVALRILGVLGRRLAASEARLEDLAYGSVPARLASVLLRLAPEAGNVIEGITHQDLGDIVGAYRETVTKILNEFQASGYVSVARRRICILDRRGLAGCLRD